MNYYLQAFTRYAVFSGRARRAEYWNFILFDGLAIIALLIVDALLGTFNMTDAGEATPLLTSLYLVVSWLPGFALTVRRFHDTGASGWTILYAFIPLVGWLLVAFFYFKDSAAGDNRFGPNPKLALA